MLQSNGRGTCRNEIPENPADGARDVLYVMVSLTPSQAAFIDSVLFHGIADLARSLRRVHDIALYHSDLPFDGAEKMALFDLKVLWEGLEQMGEV